MQFQKELIELLNKHSQENESGTPDFILAQFLIICLGAWNQSTSAREKWIKNMRGSVLNL